MLGQGIRLAIGRLPRLGPIWMTFQLFAAALARTALSCAAGRRGCAGSQTVTHLRSAVKTPSDVLVDM